MNVTTKRGEVYYISSLNDTVGSEQRSGRPAVIVSNNINNEHSNTLEICYLTLQEKPPLPTHVKISSGDCINSTVLCEQISTISISRLGDYMCRLPDSVMYKIDCACLISLGIEYFLNETVNSSNEVNVEDLKNENKALHCELDKMREICVQANDYKDRADMYERMYSDILDKLMKR